MFEMFITPGNRIDNNGPGPTTLIGFYDRPNNGGRAGYYGTIPPSSFITGAELATLCNVTQGTVFGQDAPWLKFHLDGKILYLPQVPNKTDPPACAGSEFNRLIYNIWSGGPVTYQEGTKWAAFSSLDLDNPSTNQPGFVWYTREISLERPVDVSARVNISGAPNTSYNPNTDTSGLYGWRPVLELIR